MKVLGIKDSEKIDVLTEKLIEKNKQLSKHQKRIESRLLIDKLREDYKNIQLNGFGWVQDSIDDIDT